jgi:hypothetical protein
MDWVIDSSIALAWALPDETFSLHSRHLLIEQKRQGGYGPAFFVDRLTEGYALNFLFNPKRPIKPEPRRIMVAGSGTADVSLSRI